MRWLIIFLILLLFFDIFLEFENRRKKFQSEKNILVKNYNEKIDFEKRKSALDKKADDKFFVLKIIIISLLLITSAEVWWLFNMNLLASISIISILAKFLFDKKISANFITTGLKNWIRKSVYRTHDFNLKDLKTIDLKIYHQEKKVLESEKKINDFKKYYGIRTCTL